MNILEIFIIAVGLSMDAFAVSICKGLSMEKFNMKNTLIAGLYFGIFQGGMPLIGYFVGSRFSHLVSNFDHWIVFALLALIGANMIKESQSKEACPNPSFKIKDMLPLAVATSIDALAIGVSFSLLSVNIISATSIIAATTFAISIVGIEVGRFFGSKYKSKAELVGGIILIIIGIKVLADHLIGV